MTPVIATVRELLGTRPLFGICLGHQMLAHALGLRTEKLRSGTAAPTTRCAGPTTTAWR